MAGYNPAGNVLGSGAKRRPGGRVKTSTKKPREGSAKMKVKIKISGDPQEVKKAAKSVLRGKNGSSANAG